MRILPKRYGNVHNTASQKNEELRTTVKGYIETISI